MDPSIEYLLSLGHTTKQLHGLKPKEKVEKIAKHFGLKAKHVPLTRDQSRAFLREFVQLENKNAETFGLLFRIHLADCLKTYVPSNSFDEHALTITNLPAKKFYISPEWRELRYRALSTLGNKCMACGRSPHTHGTVTHVDHILPRSIYPEYALSLANLQILCEDCNLGKSNKYENSWKR